MWPYVRTDWFVLCLRVVYECVEIMGDSGRTTNPDVICDRVIITRLVKPLNYYDSVWGANVCLFSENMAIPVKLEGWDFSVYFLAFDWLSIVVILQCSWAASDAHIHCNFAVKIPIASLEYIENIPVIQLEECGAFEALCFKANSWLWQAHRFAARWRMMFWIERPMRANG